MKLIYSSFLILLTGYVALGTFQYQKVLTESIQVIKDDIAFDLATAQVLSAQKKVETLKKFGFKDLRIVSEIPDQFEQKALVTKVPLTVDGMLVGYIIDSPSILTLGEFVLGSTYLGVLFITLFIFMSLMIIIPLARYKRGVQQFIKDAKERPLVQQDAAQFDEVTVQILEIINLNTDYVLKIRQLDYEVKEKEAVATLAKQVAHDIRSPLSVLNMLVPTLTDDPSIEKCELLVQATQRIDKIAEDLLTKGKIEIANNQFATEDVEKLVLEKQMLLASQSQKTRIELNLPKSKLFNTKISKLDFERITSNLLNNAIEAISSDSYGLVELGLSEVDNSTVLVIKDNGKGIAEETLARIGTKGYSFGKANGNGLGLFHAKSTIEKAGGHFQLQSLLGQGTTVTITI